MHLRYRNKFFRDEEGDELESDTAARTHAIATAKDMILRTRTDIIHNWFDCTFEVNDQGGRTVLVLPFGETLSDHLDGSADYLR
jgi:hypothetical protein